MNISQKLEMFEKVKKFHCPRYDELPDIGLYLEQVLNIINNVMNPLMINGDKTTGAMISNYIKNGAIESPEKKKYYREHLCYLIIISILKTVFTIQQISKLFDVQKKTYPLETAYNYFCCEFENALNEVINFTGLPLPCIETRRTEQTVLIRAMVLAVSNKIFVDLSI